VVGRLPPLVVEGRCPNSTPDREGGQEPWRGPRSRARPPIVRRGRLPEDAAGSDPFAAEDPLFAQTVAASLQGRAGQALRRLRSAVGELANVRNSELAKCGNLDRATTRASHAPRLSRSET
jgi:hypothetical protein